MTSAPETAVVLALGSNLGDRIATLQGAVDALAEAPGFVVDAVSRVYETDPVGGPDQDDYLNAVVVGRTVLQPRRLLELAHLVEDRFGRVREVRWGPRTLDVDVVAIGALRLDDPDLTVPHPRAAERAFVLVPWADTDPRAQLPGVGTVREVLEGVDATGVRLRSDLLLQVPR